MAWPLSADRTAPDTPVTVAAWGATIAWLLISALVFFGMAGGTAGLDPLRVMMVPVAVFAPVALIWIAAFLTRRISALTRAVEQLEAGAAGGEIGLRLDALAVGQRDLKAALAGTGPTDAPTGPAVEPRPAQASPGADTRPPAATAATAAPGAPRPDPSRAAPDGAAAPKPRSKAAAATGAEADRRETPSEPARDAAAGDRETAGPAPDPVAAPDPDRPAPPDTPASPTATATSTADAAASARADGAEAGAPPAEVPAAPPPASGGALPAGTLIHALHFPADPDDREGFRALRRALRDPAAKPVVTAAQDMLTLLSELGLYMDDVAPSSAPVASWRRFAGGERGAGVADIAGPGDAAAQEKIAAKLRSDPVFGDAAAHFSRLFERLLAEREPEMEDEDLSALARTRSARAFTMVGRARGDFD